ncbi:MAG: type VI secretion system tube protein Hcp [Desulfosarcina sp.]|nr:type VI secretion system tube protein Hcp [Desulfosarcina sp.]
MAVDITLKIDGINGESKIDGHEKEIDVLAWSWGVSQSGSMHVGGGGGAGKANIQDVSVTKYVDKASTNLLRKCCNGAHLKKAIMTVRKSGENPVDYVVIQMEPIMVTSVSTGGSGGEDRLTENITLNFAKVKFSYTPQKDDGSADAAIDLTWNIETNKEE